MSKLEQLAKDFANAHIENLTAAKERKTYLESHECQGPEVSGSLPEWFSDDERARCWQLTKESGCWCEACKGSLPLQERFTASVIRRRVTMVKLVTEGTK